MGVYRLAGGTATDILVHFPASFSSWLNDILRLSIASRRIALVSAVCPPARRIYVGSYRSVRPGRPGPMWVPGSILERP